MARRPPLCSIAMAGRFASPAILSCTVLRWPRAACLLYRGLAPVEWNGPARTAPARSVPLLPASLALLARRQRAGPIAGIEAREPLARRGRVAAVERAGRGVERSLRLRFAPVLPAQ